ncbi:MAG: choice-of-anchor tandem repeat GloVer-containing protein [Candidatus Cybelea sp.]|jgi:uncharacterized repeat protein (TIGR03803 family)
MIVSTRNCLAACIGAFALTACGAPRLAPLAQDDMQQRIGASRTAARGLTSVSFQVLHRFGVHAQESRDIGGANPDGGLIDVNGRLYGTTVNGGKYNNSSACAGFSGIGCGIVYSISTGTKKVLHYFLGQNSGDGNEPAYDLIDVKDTLYDTTSFGGACGSQSSGTVYSITTTGSEKVLHSFCASSSGSGGGAAIPTGGVINVDGTLYGPAGPSVDGDVYSITASGAYNVLYAFRGPNYGDGYGPRGSLLDVNGMLYGVTYLGGASGSSSAGYGIVYALTRSGKEKVLYSFQGAPDGSEPFSGLINVNGRLYGTTFSGGKSGCQNNFGCGVVYSITTSGSEKVVYRFKGGSSLDGGNPLAGLVEMNGTLYGTTYGGGADGLGTVFSISTSGGEHVLHSFGGSDGDEPRADLTDVNGTLYGTTYSGGDEKGCGGKGCGTVFALTP